MNNYSFKHVGTSLSRDGECKGSSEVFLNGIECRVKVEMNSPSPAMVTSNIYENGNFSREGQKTNSFKKVVGCINMVWGQF